MSAWEPASWPSPPEAGPRLDEGAPPGANLHVEPDVFARSARALYADEAG